MVFIGCDKGARRRLEVRDMGNQKFTEAHWHNIFIFFLGYISKQLVYCHYLCCCIVYFMGSVLLTLTAIFPLFSIVLIPIMMFAIVIMIRFFSNPRHLILAIALSIFGFYYYL